MVWCGSRGPWRSSATRRESELERHEAARARLEKDGTPKDWARFHGSALQLVIAIAQVLAYEARIRSLTGDAELRRARERFNYVARRAEAIRDIAADRGLRLSAPPFAEDEPVGAAGHAGAKRPVIIEPS